MTYTVRFAHLAERPSFKIGQTIRRGNRIGRMGNSGKSTAAHLHQDTVRGLHTRRYTQAEIEAGDPVPAPRQAAFFIDSELFGIKPVITAGYADPVYLADFKKLHMGFDAVPWDRHRSQDHFWIHWNRSMPGRVLEILDDPDGYGYCLYIGFEVGGT